MGVLKYGWDALGSMYGDYIGRYCGWLIVWGYGFKGIYWNIGSETICLDGETGFMNGDWVWIAGFLYSEVPNLLDRTWVLFKGALVTLATTAELVTIFLGESGFGGSLIIEAYSFVLESGDVTFL